MYTLLISFASLYALKHFEAYLQTTRLRFLTTGTGFLKLYLLYNIQKHLTILQLPLTGFPLYIFDKFNTMYSLSYCLSLLTWIIGFPMLTSLAYYAQFLISMVIKRISNDHLIINGRPVQMIYVLQSLQNFVQALISNENWSLSYGEITLRTQQSTIVLTEAQINERCPLRCSGSDNSIQRDVSCSICTEIIGIQQLHRQLPCEHLFHAPCCDQWLMVHRTCPNCRREI
jgi:hypothetical protein